MRAQLLLLILMSVFANAQPNVRTLVPAGSFHIIKLLSAEYQSMKAFAFTQRDGRLYFLLTHPSGSAAIAVTDLEGDLERVFPVKVSNPMTTWIGVAAEGSIIFLRRQEQDAQGALERVLAFDKNGNQLRSWVARPGFVNCAVVGMKLACAPSRHELQVFNPDGTLLIAKDWRSPAELHSILETAYHNRIHAAALDSRHLAVVHENDLSGYIFDTTTGNRITRSYTSEDLIAIRDKAHPLQKKDLVVVKRMAGGANGRLWFLPGRYSPSKGAEIISVTADGREVQTYRCRMGRFPDHETKTTPDGTMWPTLFDVAENAAYFVDVRGGVTRCMLPKE